MEDDGFDGGVVTELAELSVDLIGVQDDSVDVDDGDLAGGEADGSGGAGDGAHRDPDHEGHEEGKSGERAADDADIEPDRASWRSREAVGG